MKKRLTSQIFGGLVLIGLGVLFLMRQLGYTDINIGSLFSTYWPAILIYIGVQNLLGDSSKGNSFLGGIFFISLGVFFLGRNLDWFDLSGSDFFRMFIPVMLIGGGLYIIFKPRRSQPPAPPAPPMPPGPFPQGRDPLDAPPPKPLESTLDEQFEQKFGKSAGTRDWNDYLNKDQTDAGSSQAGPSTPEQRWQEKQERHERKRQERHERHGHRPGKWHEDFKDENFSGNSKDSTNRSAFIGDIHMGREHFQLKNSNISQFIGDTVLDLTNAQIAYGETKVNISAFVGDIKVYIPDDMDLGISVNSSSFIGDMEVLDQSRSGFMSNVQCSTPYYKEAGKKVRINVSAFIGDIKVKTVG
ncbi:cell wall-active antibiotics response protein LiaF [Paenibacillus donghaensis]|uniref:Cell wall-active antibiotics response protein n=1 Tax=Paenibacillus donghaensis TaxID=414771 RepID=A0A2Z2K3P1_9BACL|nr:cell wall-active antibiotics response protein LiaF [Paenibacillus donghaensis]ASA20056.1 hypothetical protein B9T62_04150 [Paenibacillus donghaensis]